MALTRLFEPRAFAVFKPRTDQPSVKFPLLLTSPTLLVVFVIFGIPLVYALALSMHRINMLTQQWIFVGLDNYIDILPDPEFIAALGPDSLFRLRDGGRRAAARHRHGADSQHGLPCPQFSAERGSRPLGDGAGRRGRALGMDVQRRVRHLQRSPVRSRADREADPLAGRRHRRLQPGRAGAHLEPGAARRAADPGGPPVDAGEPAPRGTNRRCRS